MNTLKTVYVQDLGSMDYQQAWDFQERLLAENVAIKARKRMNGAKAEPADTRHHLLLVEHPPVYTLGKSGKPEHVLIGEEELRKRQIAYYHINRGGDITFHGPGQLVAYPILDLEKFYTDIGRYLRELEEVIIRIMAVYGLRGERSQGETGVWLDADKPGRERKICAMGIRCSRWVTMHGLAFNVNTDLQYFGHIVPCGIVGKQVTSLQRELGREMDMEEVKAEFCRQFEAVFGVELANTAC